MINLKGKYLSRSLASGDLDQIKECLSRKIFLAESVQDFKENSYILREKNLFRNNSAVVFMKDVYLEQFSEVFPIPINLDTIMYRVIDDTSTMIVPWPTKESDLEKDLSAEEFEKQRYWHPKILREIRMFFNPFTDEKYIFGVGFYDKAIRTEQIPLTPRVA